MRPGHGRRGARPPGLVLSGGGARGVFQVGVYERLLEDPRFARGPAVISGTSAGTIKAAPTAAGKMPPPMLPFWNQNPDPPPLSARPALFRSGGRNASRLRSRKRIRPPN